MYACELFFTTIFVSTLLMNAIISGSTFKVYSSALCYFQLLIIHSKFTTAHISESNYKNNFKFFRQEDLFTSSLGSQR